MIYVTWDVSKDTDLMISITQATMRDAINKLSGRNLPEPQPPKE